MKYLKPLIAALALTGVMSAHAEIELTVYGGIQSSPHSSVTDPIPSKGSFTAGWEGKSFDMPPYYGFRYTNWTDAEWGWNVNFVHAKAYSNDETRSVSQYKTLEFTDGANPITLNVMRRFNKTEMGLTPYVAFGGGFAVPHVELQREGSTRKTSEFQFTGPVIDGSIGFTYPINDKLNLMTEYTMHVIRMNVKMDGEANRLKTTLITNALNVGVNYRY